MTSSHQRRAGPKDIHWAQQERTQEHSQLRSNLPAENSANVAGGAVCNTRERRRRPGGGRRGRLPRLPRANAGAARDAGARQRRGGPASRPAVLGLPTVNSNSFYKLESLLPVPGYQPTHASTTWVPLRLVIIWAYVKSS